MVRSALAAVWPALVLLVAVTGAFVWQLTQPEVGRYAGGVVTAGLSQAALSEGRWWTLGSQMLIQNNPVAQALSILLIGGLAWMAVMIGDPRWLGGWRAIGLFLGAGLAAAVVHLLLDPTRFMTGVWPGLAALFVFELLIRRQAPPSTPAEAERELGGLSDEIAERQKVFLRAIGFAAPLGLVLWFGKENLAPVLVGGALALLGVLAVRLAIHLWPRAASGVLARVSGVAWMLYPVLILAVSVGYIFVTAEAPLQAWDQLATVAVGALVGGFAALATRRTRAPDER